MKNILIVLLFSSPFAHAEKYVAQAQFGDKTVIATAHVQFAKEIATNAATAQVEENPLSCDQGTVCKIESVTEVGTAEVSVQIQDAAGNLVAGTGMSPIPLELTSLSVLNDSNCDLGSNNRFQDQANSSWIINHSFGDLFGRTESSLSIAVQAVLPEVRSELNQKTPLSREAVMQHLEIQASIAFYYKNPGESLPEIKDSQTFIFKRVK